MRSDVNKLIAEYECKWKSLFFVSLAAAVVLASAFHFWPFEDSKAWQMLNIPNLCCGIAIAFAAVLLIIQKSRNTVLSYVPHVSILAYLAINILSVSIADTLSRPVNYTIKLALVLIGGLFLFQKSLSKPKVLTLFYILISIAVSLSILACIYIRLAFDPKQFGLHDNVFKYGTYIGILVPLACMYLVSGSKRHILWAVLIATAGIFSAGSIGAVFSIFAGFLTGFILSKDKSIKTYLFVCLLLSTAALFLSDNVFEGEIRRDFALKENDGINLRQRYIEWQAEINLLENRGITGTGAGCVNDYRSNFYYRLPKLNTLKAFDQNGFLAVAAETGLLGLACFIWILIHYGTMSLKDCLSLKADKNSKTAAMATANIAGFVSVMIANLFSSVHYNGILIIFVLLLSLISSVNKINGGTPGED